MHQYATQLKGHRTARVTGQQGGFPGLVLESEKLHSVKFILLTPKKKSGREIKCMSLVFDLLYTLTCTTHHGPLAGPVMGSTCLCMAPDCPWVVYPLPRLAPAFTTTAVKILWFAFKFVACADSIFYYTDVKKIGPFWAILGI